MKIIPEMESPYRQQLIKDLSFGSGALPKLVPNLLDQRNCRTLSSPRAVLSTGNSRR